MEGKKLCPILDIEEPKANKMLQTGDKANILNSSNYTIDINKNRLEQNTEDIKNEKGFLDYQNNFTINQSLGQTNIETKNSSINLINKGNSNYLNKYNIINKYYNNIYNEKQKEQINTINNENNILFSQFKNLNNENSENNFYFDFQNKINNNEVNSKINSNYIQKKYIKNKDLKRKITLNINIILNLLSNYKGSIFLQKALLNMNFTEIALLFQIIYPYICTIMCLEFGNYFMQKLIKYLNVQQRIDIYKIINNNFLVIATNKSGTHSIQALFDGIQTPIEQFYFEKLLFKDLLLLFNNENGYHIIMKIILQVNESQRNNLNAFFISNVEKIITNQYGAYCGTKFILFNSNLNYRILLINKIRDNMKNFIFNKYSCSVIIFAIKKFGVDNFQFIISEIKNNLSFLSLHPISNLFVCRIFEYLKYIEYSNISSILWNIYRNDNLIKGLCSSKSGNILLKKLMEYSNGTQKKFIKKKIKYFKKI